MARSEQLRNEIARLEKTAADHRTKIATADKKATGAPRQGCEGVGEGQQGDRLLPTDGYLRRRT
jgi:septal ring factor EnvC (AmiA/AmiB activator)